jgi:hypothetical protein
MPLTFESELVVFWLVTFTDAQMVDYPAIPFDLAWMGSIRAPGDDDSLAADLRPVVADMRRCASVLLSEPSIDVDRFATNF